MYSHLVVYQVQVVEHIPLPVSSNYQYYVWENGKLPHNPLCYPRQVVKMTDCKVSQSLNSVRR